MLSTRTGIRKHAKILRAAKRMEVDFRASGSVNSFRFRLREMKSLSHFPGVDRTRSGVLAAGSAAATPAEATAAPHPTAAGACGVGCLHGPVSQFINGALQTANGVLQTANGVPHSANGAHQIAPGPLRITTGELRTANGLLRISNEAAQKISGPSEILDGAAQTANGSVPRPHVPFPHPRRHPKSPRTGIFLAPPRRNLSFG